MLRECEVHGYFRDESCPVCGEEGKFLMSAEEMDKIGRTMAGVLRHFPERFDLEMDEQGYVDLRDLVSAMRDKSRRMHWMRSHHIVALVESDPKGRYQVSNDKVRASYGHTFDLDLRHPTDDIPDELFYPATPEEAEIILEMGIIPSDRRMVHLSKTYEDAHSAGSVRVDEPVILAVDTAAAIADGVAIGRAARTVYLCKEVPPQYLSVRQR